MAFLLRNNLLVFVGSTILYFQFKHNYNYSFFENLGNLFLISGT